MPLRINKDKQDVRGRSEVVKGRSESWVEEGEGRTEKLESEMNRRDPTSREKKRV